MIENKAQSSVIPAIAAALSLAGVVMAAYLFNQLEAANTIDWVQLVLSLAFLAWIQPVVAFVVIAAKKRMGVRSHDELAYIAMLQQWVGIGFLVWCFSDISSLMQKDLINILVWTIPAGFFAVWIVAGCAYRSLMSLKTEKD